MRRPTFVEVIEKKKKFFLHPQIVDDLFSQSIYVMPIQQFGNFLLRESSFTAFSIFCLVVFAQLRQESGQAFREIAFSYVSIRIINLSEFSVRDEKPRISCMWKTIF